MVCEAVVWKKTVGFEQGQELWQEVSAGRWLDPHDSGSFTRRSYVGPFSGKIQPVLELAQVVGDLGLGHIESPLELADADAGALVFGRNVAVGQLATTAPGGHHPEHPDPDRVRECDP